MEYILFVLGVGMMGVLGFAFVRGAKAVTAKSAIAAERNTTTVVNRKRQARVAQGQVVKFATSTGKRREAVIVGRGKRGYELQLAGHPAGPVFRRKAVYA